MDHLKLKWIRNEVGHEVVSDSKKTDEQLGDPS